MGQYRDAKTGFTQFLNQLKGERLCSEQILYDACCHNKHTSTGHGDMQHVVFVAMALLSVSNVSVDIISNYISLWLAVQVLYF